MVLKNYRKTWIEMDNDKSFVFKKKLSQREHVFKIQRFYLKKCDNHTKRNKLGENKYNFNDKYFYKNKFVIK